MDSTAHFLRLAAYNNAVWCDTVCRSHDIMGEFHDTYWISRQQTPMYYPDMVTLSPTFNLVTQQDAVAELLTATKRDYAVSVKDSYAVLDLTPFNFHELFRAQWLFRQVPAALSGQEMAGLEWKQVVSESELLRWEEAWSQPPATRNHLFHPTLLHDADICIIAGYQESQIVAGGIANRTGEVVGLSNVFGPKQEAERYWKGLLSVIAARFPDLPLVGYEWGESLETALRVGFTTLGPLRVWIKEA